MHEPLLAGAALPEPPILFRLRLRPYSIGHELHLWRRANPMVSNPFSEIKALERSKRLAAVMQAVHVCANDFAGNFKPIKNLRLWTWIARRANLDDSMVALWNYIQIGRSAFEADFQSDVKTRPIGCPAILRLYQFICENVPDREILIYGRSRWDFPFSLAVMMMQAHEERDGGLSIRNFVDVAREDYVQEMDRLEAEGKIEWPKVKVNANA
jgi:hypothetical protein